MHTQTRAHTHAHIHARVQKRGLHVVVTGAAGDSIGVFRNACHENSVISCNSLFGREGVEAPPLACLNPAHNHETRCTNTHTKRETRTQTHHTQNMSSLHDHVITGINYTSNLVANGRVGAEGEGRGGRGEQGPCMWVEGWGEGRWGEGGGWAVGVGSYRVPGAHHPQKGAGSPTVATPRRQGNNSKKREIERKKGREKKVFPFF